MWSESVAVTIQVIEVFETLNVPYLVGGSVASMVHGVIRTTMDSDLVADLQLDHVPAFVRVLSPAFYLDAGMIRQAIRTRSSFNVIHLKTMFKVDVFILKKRPFDEAQIRRRELQVIADDPQRSVYVATAEDTILAKLAWYRQGNEVSERQWRDVLGVLAVHRGRLDMGYLRHWAADLEIEDLLTRTLDEAAQIGA